MNNISVPYMTTISCLFIKDQVSLTDLDIVRMFAFGPFPLKALATGGTLKHAHV